MPSFDHFLDLAERPLSTWLGAFAVAIVFAIGVHRIGARVLIR